MAQAKTKIRVGGVQMLHHEGDRTGNLERAREMILATPDLDLYVLPELAVSGYGRKAFAKLDDLAEDAMGPSFQFFSELAKERNCYISYGFPRRQPGGKLTISAAVVDDLGGLVAIYDKWHVCQNGDCYEKQYFDPGNTPIATFSLGTIKIGICICYDIRFPELVRKLTVEGGIHLLIHPGGWPRDEGFKTWHSFVTTRAIENTIYIMSPNRASESNGYSVFCPPFVDMQSITPQMLADPEAEGVLIGEVDLDHLIKTRETFTLLEDRRPELYSGVSSQRG